MSLWWLHLAGRRRAVPAVATYGRPAVTRIGANAWNASRRITNLIRHRRNRHTCAMSAIDTRQLLTCVAWPYAPRHVDVKQKTA